MISFPEAILLGLLQGFAELFPISSLGHSVLIPALLGWNLDQSSDGFLSFIVLTHLATALVLLAFFWRDWLRIIAGIFRSLRQREIRAEDTYARIGWLLIVATIPAGVLGILFEERLKQLFAVADVIAVVLILNGIALYAVERLFRWRRSDEGAYDDESIAALTWTNCLTIGLAQCLALLPGFSRTGMTIAGGLSTGLSHDNAARFSFLLATPIILAAAVLKVPDLFATGLAGAGPAFVGAICSAASAFVSVRFLLRYFESRTLTPFAIYCVAAGLLSLALLRF
ncbi:MAG: undecaprenyl-diphosphate phosphatase [Rhizobiales bacterium]|nr:undecaprenyl-diphosphate phosphatase [Hyphomicrobiales bacterium]